MLSFCAVIQMKVSKNIYFFFFFFLFLVDPMFSPHSTSMTMMEEHIYRSVGLLEKRSLPGLFTK